VLICRTVKRCKIVLTENCKPVFPGRYSSGLKRAGLVENFGAALWQMHERSDDENRAVRARHVNSWFKTLQLE